MAETDDPRFNVGPPPEASRYFRNRSIRPSFSWEDVAPEEHAVSFSAAKAMRTDVITTLQGALQEALDNGTTLAEFRRTMPERLKALGWWGEGDILDDAGNVVGQGMRGSPRRLRTIYRANMRTARAAGQWERIERTADALPYLVYLLGPSRKHRPEHEAKEGMVLSVDDPFWEQWMPPNGWGCKCHVRQITRREAASRGISETPDIGTRPVRNKATGEVVQVPDGIDPGWQRNPGFLRAQAAERHLQGRLIDATPAVRRAALADIAGSWRVREMLAGRATGSVPIGVLDDGIATALGVDVPIVNLYAPTAEKLALKHTEISTSTMPGISRLIEDAPAVLEVTEQGKRTVQFVGQTDDGLWRLVIKATQDGREAIATTVHRARPDQLEGLLRRDTVTRLR